MEGGGPACSSKWLHFQKLNQESHLLICFCGGGEGGVALRSWWRVLRLLEQEAGLKGLKRERVQRHWCNNWY